MSRVRRREDTHTIKSIRTRGVDNKTTHTHKQPLSFYIHLDGHFRKLYHFMPTFLVLFVVRPVIYMYNVTFQAYFSQFNRLDNSYNDVTRLASARRFALHNPLPVTFRVKEWNKPKLIV